MNRLRKHPLLMLTLGVTLGTAAIISLPSDQLKASSANSNDKFSMCTVATSTGRTSEAVVVLDHLTGTLTVNAIGQPKVGQNAFSTTGFSYQCAQDFQLNAATPDPKYVLVSGQSTNLLNGFSSGVLYVGELSSGTVVAYAFPATSGRAAPGIQKIGAFPFRVAIGG